MLRPFLQWFQGPVQNPKVGRPDPMVCLRGDVYTLLLCGNVVEDQSTQLGPLE